MKTKLYTYFLVLFITVADKEKLLTKADALAIFLTKDDKVDIIKWMVGLIIGLFVALIGSLSAIMFAMLHAYLK